MIRKTLQTVNASEPNDIVARVRISRNGEHIQVIQLNLSEEMLERLSVGSAIVLPVNEPDEQVATA